MKAIKRINNNVVLCISKKGEQFIAMGKGIGFHDFPYELNICDVQRTYYDVDPVYYSMLNDIPEDVFNLAGKIIEKANHSLDGALGSNIVFTLADHINFTIERYKKNMNIKLPLVYDVEHLFEKEYEIGVYGITLIGEELKVWLPSEEAAYIALHIINTEEKNRNIAQDNEIIVNDITSIIEKEYGIQIDKKNFNYSRFVSHLYYLLKRGKSKHLVVSDNKALYEEVTRNYPQSHICAKKIVGYLKTNLGFELSEEEILYLMLHINRLCTREECYR